MIDPWGFFHERNPKLSQKISAVDIGSYADASGKPGISSYTRSDDNTL